MSHPNHEELTEFLYDELAPARQAEVAQHVESCDDCRATIEAWRGVRTNLTAWKLPASPVVLPARSRRVVGGLRWAVAAAVLLATGYGMARLTAKPVDLAALRADLVRDVRKEVRQELATELTAHAAQQLAWQQDFQAAVVDAMSQLETRQVVNHASLRKDVETVALHAQEEFDRLASSSQAPAYDAPRAQ
jgi:hypothetical protein